MPPFRRFEHEHEHEHEHGDPNLTLPVRHLVNNPG
jgi:hypothetical protein